MLRISRLADYASVIMSFLAKHPGQCFSAAALTEQICINLPTVSKVLKLLNDAELLVSSRGTNGGYQLKCPPQQISLAAIIGAIDGELALTECSKEESGCEHDMNCGLRNSWQYVNRIVMDVLSKVSLVDMGRSLNESPIKFFEAQSE